MREVLFTDRAELPVARLAQLRTELAPKRTLADVLAWTRRQTPPAEVVEIVTQDEYTHDVVVGAGPAGERLFLVFDTT